MDTNALHELLVNTKHRIDDSRGGAWRLQLDPILLKSLDDVLIGSDFVADQLVSDPGLIDWLNIHFSTSIEGHRLVSCVKSLFDSEWTEKELMSELRRLRNRVQVGLIWHDLSRLVDVWTLTSASVSIC